MRNSTDAYAIPFPYGEPLAVVTLLEVAMESNHFDALTVQLAVPLSRRRGIGLLGLIGLAGMLPDDAAAKRKKKKKKKKPCKPACDGKTCGDDGCGGTCGACSACQECGGGTCAAKTDGVPCGDGCQTCQGGQCVARPDGEACETDSCTTCQGGRCAPKADNTNCAEHAIGKCRAGLCRERPVCLAFGNQGPCNGTVLNCCALNPGELCPPVPPPTACPNKGIAGRRCQFNSDCQSDSCVGYQCA